MFVQERNDATDDIHALHVFWNFFHRADRFYAARYRDGPDQSLTFTREGSVAVDPSPPLRRRVWCRRCIISW